MSFLFDCIQDLIAYVSRYIETDRYFCLLIPSTFYSMDSTINGEEWMDGWINIDILLLGNFFSYADLRQDLDREDHHP